MKIFFWICLFINLSAAAEKYTLSICALFKNESPYLREWIEYHKLIGVNHFYLYNNGHADAPKKILAPYIKSKLVTLIQWPDLATPAAHDDAIWVLSTQVSAYENAAKWKALYDTKWLLFLDIDEFLVPCSENKISQILQEYDEYPGVILSSEHYDASIRSILPPRKLVIEATEMIAPHKRSLLRTVEKTIFKPKLCTSISWPPYHCCFQKGAKALQLGKRVLKVNRYENRMGFHRSANVKKKLVIDRQFLPEKEMEELLKLGYEIEDQERPIYRFLPALCTKIF